MDWAALIGQVGGPGALCGVLLWWINKREARNAQETQAREQAMTGRIDKLQADVLSMATTVIAENTDAMRRMTHTIQEIREHCAGIRE